MGNRNLEKENMELRRQLEAVTGALELLVAGIEASVSETFIPLAQARAALAAVRETADHSEVALDMVGSPAWVSLTDEDRERVLKAMPDWLDGFLKKWGWLNFAKAIEDACREKNSNIGSPAGEGGEA